MMDNKYVPMSDADIKKYMPAVVYDEFFKKTNKKLPIIILYEQTPGYGHWCMIHDTIDNKEKKCIEFFDSYGKTIDHTQKVFNKKYNPKLVKWLMGSGKNIAFNQFQFQSDNPDIMTCGRHCIARNMFKKYSVEQYFKKMKKVSNMTGLSFDDIVSIIVP